MDDDDIDPSDPNNDLSMLDDPRISDWMRLALTDPELQDLPEYVRPAVFSLSEFELDTENFTEEERQRIRQNRLETMASHRSRCD
jgi:hypothetical protein